MFEDSRGFQLNGAYIESVFGMCVYVRVCVCVIYTSTGKAKG